MGPFKCPECGIWWAGFEHSCKPLQVSNTTNIIGLGHCHGCSTARCQANDHYPCLLHERGWTVS